MPITEETIVLMASNIAAGLIGPQELVEHGNLNADYATPAETVATRAYDIALAIVKKAPGYAKPEPK